MRTAEPDRGCDAELIGVLNEPICFSPHLCHARNLVERFIKKIRHRRRVATRYTELAANYLAFIQLGSIRLRRPVHTR
jgi:transposase